jgi:hypothetical protein
VTNLAKPKTRAQLVYEYLAARPNQWVPGMEIMSKEVGGTRAGGRILELRQAGHLIERRPSKTSAVHEYRLVVEEAEQIRMAL